MKPYFKDKLTGLVCYETKTGNLFVVSVKSCIFFLSVKFYLLFLCFQGPPANEETKARLSHGTRPADELKIKRCMFYGSMLACYYLYVSNFLIKIKTCLFLSGDGWQKTLLTNAVAKDTMKRMLQRKLSK